MADQNLVPFPLQMELVTCRIAIPSFGYAIDLHGGAVSGLAALSEDFALVSEQLEGLSAIFEEYSAATFNPSTIFSNGYIVFEFKVPRHLLKKLEDLGWEPEDLDIEDVDASDG